MKTLAAILMTIAFTLCADAAEVKIRLTIYDDGKSCPGGCDAHVVFHSSLNGTEFAHEPGSVAGPYTKCETGQICEICTRSNRAQCVTVMYRGSGPSKNTFDLTPRYYETACADATSPVDIREKCGELQAAASALAGRLNCIKNPPYPQCKELVESAISKQTTDQKPYDKCLSVGESAFNASQSDDASRRSLDCVYEFKATGGPNKKGVTWKRLLPAGCRSGTFVGRDGLDCCAGIPSIDGPLGVECRQFYPKPKAK